MSSDKASHEPMPPEDRAILLQCEVLVSAGLDVLVESPAELGRRKDRRTEEMFRWAGRVRWLMLRQTGPLDEEVRAKLLQLAAALQRVLADRRLEGGAGHVS